jgi:hypothetical protein
MPSMSAWAWVVLSGGAEVEPGKSPPERARDRPPVRAVTLTSPVEVVVAGPPLPNLDDPVDEDDLHGFDRVGVMVTGWKWGEGAWLRSAVVHFCRAADLPPPPWRPESLLAAVWPGVRFTLRNQTLPRFLDEPPPETKKGQGAAARRTP